MRRYTHWTDAAEPLKHASSRRNDKCSPVGLVSEQLPVSGL